MSIKNKVVLVTGGGMSLGQVLCLRFAKEGAKVGFCDLKEDYLEETARKIRDAGGDVFPMVCDVSDWDQVDKWIGATAEHFGRVDVLINNACYHQLRDAHKGVPVHEFRIDDFDRSIAVNVRGVFLCMRRVVPEMLKVGQGRIINIGSVDGMHPPINQIGYNTGKGACHYLTISAAQDLARMNITVNCIAPGGFPSHLYDMGEYQKRDDGAWGLAREEVINLFEERMPKRNPIPRVLPVEEVAAAAVYLAGDEAGYVNAHILLVDGGRIPLHLR